MANEEYPEGEPELQKDFESIDLGEKEEIEDDLEKVKELFDEEVSTPELAGKKEEPEEEEGGEFDDEFKEISGEEKEKPHKHHEEKDKDEEDSDEEDQEKEEHPEDEEE